MTSIAVVMPIGPGIDELERGLDTILSLSCEPAVRWVIVIDDAPVSRNLKRRIAPLTSAEVQELPPPAHRKRAKLEERVAASTLLGFGWAAVCTDADFVMKLDTDALVIDAFAEKLVAAANAEPNVGLFGSYDRDCNGHVRSFAPWERPVRRAARIFQLRRVAISRQARRARRYIHEANERGYQWGEHALGCSIAVPRPALDEMSRSDSFLDPLVFARTGLGDDPALGILVRRAGFRLAGNVADGQTFAVSWRGLPDSPERLAERGYSIIHSVKNDGHFSEDDIRGFFRAIRATSEELAPGCHEM